jgi:hypothetical protein
MPDDLLWLREMAPTYQTSPTELSKCAFMEAHGTAGSVPSLGRWALPLTFTHTECVHTVRTCTTQPTATFARLHMLSAIVFNLASFNWLLTEVDLE